MHLTVWNGEVELVEGSRRAEVLDQPAGRDRRTGVGRGGCGRSVNLHAHASTMLFLSGPGQGIATERVVTKVPGAAHVTKPPRRRSGTFNPCPSTSVSGGSSYEDRAPG